MELKDEKGSFGVYRVSPNPEYDRVVGVLGIPRMRAPFKVDLRNRDNWVEAERNPRVRTWLQLESFPYFGKSNRTVIGSYIAPIEAFFTFPCELERFKDWRVGLDRHENMHAVVHQIEQRYKIKGEVLSALEARRNRLDQTLGGKVAEGIAEWGVVEVEARVRGLRDLDERVRFHHSLKGLERLLSDLDFYDHGRRVVVKIMNELQRGGYSVFEALVLLINFWPAKREAFDDPTSYGRRLVADVANLQSSSLTSGILRE